MLTATTNVAFRGFTPSEDTKQYVDSLVTELSIESPRHSLVNASFSRSKGIVKGIVRISSQAGEFFAVASEQDIHTVGRKLLERVRKQLSRWHNAVRNHDSIKGG